MTCIHKERVARLTRDRLHECRIIPIQGEIDDALALEVIARMLHLQDESPFLPLELYINSPGGSVAAAAAIRDTIDDLKAPVHTCCIGEGQGAAAFILAHGKKPYRHACQGSNISLSRLTSERTGQWVRQDLVKAERTVAGFFATDTSRTAEEVLQHMAEGRSFDAPGALEYGLIDMIVE